MFEEVVSLGELVLEEVKATLALMPRDPVIVLRITAGCIVSATIPPVYYTAAFQSLGLAPLSGVCTVVVSTLRHGPATKMEHRSVQSHCSCDGPH